MGEGAGGADCTKHLAQVKHAVSACPAHGCVTEGSRGWRCMGRGLLGEHAYTCHCTGSLTLLRCSMGLEGADLDLVILFGWLPSQLQQVQCAVYPKWVVSRVCECRPKGCSSSHSASTSRTGRCNNNNTHTHTLSLGTPHSSHSPDSVDVCVLTGVWSLCRSHQCLWCWHHPLPSCLLTALCQLHFATSVPGASGVEQLRVTRNPPQRAGYIEGWLHRGLWG